MVLVFPPKRVDEIESRPAAVATKKQTAEMGCIDNLSMSLALNILISMAITTNTTTGISNSLDRLLSGGIKFPSSMMH